MRSIRFALLLAATFITVWSSHVRVNAETQAGGKGLVRVFILAGQSNMVGDGHVEPSETKGTLAYMVRCPDKRSQFKHLVDQNGNWVERDDVWYKA